MNRLNAKIVCEGINKESARVCYSSSQSSELRDTPTKRKGKKEQKYEYIEIVRRISSGIMLQNSGPEFTKTVLCIRDTYNIFLETIIQLDDILKVCCDSDNVLCINTTFNLCSSWVSDCCCNNDFLAANESNNPVFLGLAVAHFEKYAFLFSRFCISYW